MEPCLNLAQRVLRQETASASNRAENFEEFIYRMWGAGIAKHFAIPYNRKLWTVPLTEMETSWLGGRVPLPDLEEIIEGALRPVGKADGPECALRIPLAGRFSSDDVRLSPTYQGKDRTQRGCGAASRRRSIC